MNNFPAMTEDQRSVLIGRLQIYIRTAETAIKAGLATENDLFNLDVRKIALAALTAEPDCVRYSCGCCGYESLSYKHICPKCNHHTLQADRLYTAPPAPVLRLPEEADTSNLPFAAMGWNACLAEVKRLNSQPAPREASNEQ